MNKTEQIISIPQKIYHTLYSPILLSQQLRVNTPRGYQFFPPTFLSQIEPVLFLPRELAKNKQPVITEISIYQHSPTTRKFN